MTVNLPVAQEELLKWTPQQQLEMLGRIASIVMARQSAPTLSMTIEGETEAEKKVFLLTEFPRAGARTFSPGSEDPELREFNRLAANPNYQGPLDAADFPEDH